MSVRFRPYAIELGRNASHSCESYFQSRHYWLCNIKRPLSLSQITPPRLPSYNTPLSYSPLRPLQTSQTHSQTSASPQNPNSSDSSTEGPILTISTQFAADAPALPPHLPPSSPTFHPPPSAFKYAVTPEVTARRVPWSDWKTYFHRSAYCI